MPEGPEVKIVSDFINEALHGHTISSIECISDPYKMKYGSLVDSLQHYLPFLFQPSFCIGKATYLYLDDQNYFSYHLGMTGFWSTKQSSHAHLKLSTFSGLDVFFHDARRFGNIKITSSIDLDRNFYCGDFLNYDFSIEDYALFLFENLKTEREVCKVLLDQKYFAGVGNYLKSEILYACNFHPHKKWNSFSFNDILNLCKISKFMLHKSYNGGGAQLRDFKNPSKAPDLELLIYGKELTEKNLPVTSEITKDNRRSFWCSASQIT
jgi:formamidopyrimidine-DNA glycosylase